MSTATKAAITATTVGGGALGGAALGGAFNSNSSSSKQSSTSAAIPQDNSTPKAPTPTTSPTAPKQQPQEPDWKPLSVEITSSGNTYEGKIGKEYSHLLVGPYGNSDNNNKAWWDKQFTKYNTDKTSNPTSLSPEFEKDKITLAYKEKGDSENKSLNKVCASIYEKTTQDITPTTAKDEKDKLRENLWRYCSPIGTRPQTINDVSASDQTYGDTTFGKTKKDQLLSVKDNVNDALWNLKQKEFFDLKKVDDEFFNDLHKDKQINKSKTALKDKCKEAYTKTKAEGKSAPSEENTVNYCSVKLMPTAS